MLDIATLQRIGLTNLTDEQIKVLTEEDEIERAKRVSNLSPTARHLLSIEEQKGLQQEIADLKEENSSLKQQNKSARFSGTVSSIAIAIGGGLISSAGPGTEHAQTLGFGWGLLILGAGFMLINSIFGP